MLIFFSWAPEGKNSGMMELKTTRHEFNEPLMMSYALRYPSIDEVTAVVPSGLVSVQEKHKLKYEKRQVEC